MTKAGKPSKEEIQKLKKQKKDNIAKLLGFNSWEQIGTKQRLVAKLMHKYLAWDTIYKALTHIDAHEGEEIQKKIDNGLLQDRYTLNFYTEYIGKNSIRDIVARQFYTQNNYNYGLVKQVADTLKNIRDAYFSGDKLFSGVEVMGVIKSEVFDDDRLFAYSDSVDLSEKVEIFQKMQSVLEHSIDPAAVILSIDNIVATEDGDGMEYFDDQEMKAMRMLMDFKTESGKAYRVSHDILLELFGVENINRIHPIAKRIITSNFSKEEVLEFLHGKGGDNFSADWSISARDDYYSEAYINAENKVNAIIYKKLEEDYFNPNAFLKKYSSRIKNEEQKELYIQAFDFIKNNVIKDIIKPKGVKRITGGYTNYMTHKYDEIITLNENGEPETQKISRTEFIKRKLVGIRNQLAKNVEEKEETLDENTLLNYSARVNAIDEVIGSLTKMKAQKMEQFLVGCNLGYKNKEKRLKTVMLYSRDWQVEREIARSASLSKKQIMPSKEELYNEHISLLIRESKYRKAGRLEQSKEIGKAFMSQKEMAKIAQKYRHRLIEFTHTKQDGLFMEEQTVLMLPASIYENELSKEGIPLQAHDDSDTLVIAKKGAFLRVELDGNNRIQEGNIEVVNPTTLGKLPGYRLTWKGEAVINNFWDKLKISEDIKTTQKSPKVKLKSFR
ncbi:MAG TPA: hypothetical protein ENN12_03225 [Epsilonproteobacteria bacterium]|nr:hypothetical protein [Campylobacterota bacterium]